MPKKKDNKKTEAKKPQVKKINKSAVTGKIVTKEFAEKNPDTTITQKVKIAKPKAPKFEPQVGGIYNFGGFFGEVVSLDPIEVIKKTVNNGVQVDEQVEVSSLKDAKPLSAEDFAELNDSGD